MTEAYDETNTIVNLFSAGLFAASCLMGLLPIRERSTTTKRNKVSRTFRLVRYLSSYDSWEEYDDDTEVFVQRLPKVELHVHLDGSFDPDFLYRYMRENPESLYCLPEASHPPWEPGRVLPIRSMVEMCRSSRDYHRLCTCRGYRSLKEMLNCFEVFLPLVRRNLSLIEHLAFDFCKRQHEQNVIYTEVRYSPHLLAEGLEKEEPTDVTAEDVLRVVTSGLRRGCETFGITVNQILCAITWRPDWAMSTLELVHKNLSNYPCATVAVDVAAGEEHFDSENYPDMHQAHFSMIQRAKELGVPITLHAGESTSEQAENNVRRAILEYGVSRVGHGYRMAQSENIMSVAREKNIHVEVCPTSSDETGGWMYEHRDWKKHPCVTFLENKVPFSLSSDDPAVFHTSLAWQYRLALAKMNFSQEDLVQSILDGADAAFCSSDEKNRVKEAIVAFACSVGIETSLCDGRVQVQQQWSTERSTSTFSDRVYLDNNEYM